MTKSIYYILPLFIFLLVSCNSLTERENEVVVYKRAVFKSWLLLESIDNYYAPPSESLAICLAPCHIGQVYTLDEDAFPANPERSDRDFYRLPGHRTAFWIKDWRFIPKHKRTKRMPESYPWELDMTWDINVYIEKLDLKWLAKLCYQNKPGCIYVIPGRRDYSNVPIPHLLAGYRGPNIFMPVQFITRGEPELSALMDNIWLLYQLERGGWITRTGSRAWKWSEKVKTLPETAAYTLAQLTDKERDYFKVLAHISGGEGGVPAIPCEVMPESRKVSVPDEESLLMRGEGSIDNWSDTLTPPRYAEKAWEEREEGINILLEHTPIIKNKGKTVVQVEELEVTGGIMKKYGPNPSDSCDRCRMGRGEGGSIRIIYNE